MLSIDLFDLVSPLEFRYLRKDRGVAQHLSERAFTSRKLDVERAVVAAYYRRGIVGGDALDAVTAACQKVTVERVYEIEDSIIHDIRALIAAIKEHLDVKYHAIVHRGLTSYDVIDTARALMYLHAVRELLVPRLKAVLRQLIRAARKEAATVQVGRTHGMHAVPLTAGYWLSGYVSRLGEAIENIEQRALQLRGKISGAVGSYNAARLFVPDPRAFEREVLAELGLEPFEHSTQVAPPEALARLISEVQLSVGILADLADDLRHLHRSEIGEVAFRKKTGSSSAMPHKANPEGVENVKSVWRIVLGRIITAMLDQTCEHQRDLTNSASARTYPEIFAFAAYQAGRMAKELESFEVVHERVAANLQMNANVILAEPLWNLLAAYGHPDAYAAVQRLVGQAKQNGCPLYVAAGADEEVALYLDQFTDPQRRAIEDPHAYVGVAEPATMEICLNWEQRLNLAA